MDILNQPGIDFADLPIRWNGVFTGGNIVKLSRGDVAKVNVIVCNLGNRFAVEGVRMMIDMADCFFSHQLDYIFAFLPG